MKKTFDIDELTDLRILTLSRQMDCSEEFILWKAVKLLDIFENMSGDIRSLMEVKG